jgi:hypothetical protein
MSLMLTKSIGFLVEQGGWKRMFVKTHFLTEVYLTRSLRECFTPVNAGPSAGEIAQTAVSSLDKINLSMSFFCFKLLAPAPLA